MSPISWLLSLLSLLKDSITLRNRREFKRKDVKRSISSELENLAVRLAGTHYRIQVHLGIRNKELLSWFRDICEKYKANISADEKEAIDRLLQLPEEQLNVLTNLVKGTEDTALGLKTFSLPLTDSILKDLTVCDSKFQKDILEVQGYIRMLNEEIESAMSFYRLTFDPKIMDVNKDIIVANIKNSYATIAKRSKIIVNKIGEIL